MDGIHDLGGKHGFGPVVMEKSEPPFHERWEAVVFAMLLATQRAGACNSADRFRHAIERIEPVAYLSHSYYGRWLGGIENLLVEAGLVSGAEITERARRMGAGTDDLVAARPDVHPDPQGEASGAGTATRDTSRAPQFRVGDRVVTGTEVKSGHTRLPAYARGKRGRVHRCHGEWVYPDTNAHGGGENPQHLYTVEFEGPALWGRHSDPSIKVYLDLFEPYLESANT